MYGMPTVRPSGGAGRGLSVKLAAEWSLCTVFGVSGRESMNWTSASSRSPAAPRMPAARRFTHPLWTESSPRCRFVPGADNARFGGNLVNLLRDGIDQQRANAFEHAARHYDVEFLAPHIQGNRNGVNHRAKIASTLFEDITSGGIAVKRGDTLEYVLAARVKRPQALHS